MKVKALNWDGERIEIDVLCESRDLRKIARAAHKEMGRRRNKAGKPYTTYMLVAVEGERFPFDVECG